MILAASKVSNRAHGNPVGVMKVRPVGREFEELAFLLPDQAVGGGDQRQCCRGVRTAFTALSRLPIEHTSCISA
jgi:hypothetical protein